MTESIQWHTGVLIKSGYTFNVTNASYTSDPGAKSINRFVFVREVVFSLTGALVVMQ